MSEVKEMTNVQQPGRICLTKRTTARTTQRNTDRPLVSFLSYRANINFSLMMCHGPSPPSPNYPTSNLTFKEPAKRQAPEILPLGTVRPVYRDRVFTTLQRTPFIRGLLEKYPTFGREKETGLLGALDT